MGVLESPITWIVVAAVLVVVAGVLLVISAVRRRRARRAAAAAAWPPPALEAGRMNPDAPWTGPTPTEERERVPVRTAVSNVSGRTESTAAARYTDPDTAPIDVDTIRARLAAELAAADAEESSDAPATRADPGADDGEPAADDGEAQATAADTGGRPPHRPRHAAVADGEGTADAATARAERHDDAGTAGAERREVSGGSHDPRGADAGSQASAPEATTPHGARPADAGSQASAPEATTPDGTRPADAESAKDRLLGVLLRDPHAAVAALAAAGHDAGRPGEGDVTALLRAGLSPAQVARLVGTDERHLAAVVARGLGLLPGDPGAASQASGGGVTTGENRTDDPGRSWANAASSAGSTTPTTG